MAHFDQHPIFWSFRRCPYAMRARLAIVTSGQKVQLREILLRDKPADFLAASPKGTVPVLKLGDGQVIDESRDIMFWALGQNDPENWLAVWQQNPASALAFLDRLDGAFKYDLDRYKYASRYDHDAGAVHRSSGAEFLAELDQDLQQTGALSGAQLGLLDFASLPFVRQFRIADPVWFDNQSWPHVHIWLGGFLDSAIFQLVMQKYPQWNADRQSIAFPPLL
ncbi:glutathione S-transferase [Alphaproteobacteria bacterium]|nr:glutathione S-transferase [Alphaproteobacteria bacterium]